MKSRITLLLAAAVVAAAASVCVAEIVDIKPDKEGAPVHRVYVLSEADLRAKMIEPRAYPDPGWIIHVPPADLAEAGKARSWNATTAKTRAWERDHVEFGNWVRNRIATGSNGRRDNPVTFTLSPLEFLSLCVDPATKWDDALAKWGSRAGPGESIDKDLVAVVNRIRLIEKPSAQEMSMAQRASSVRDAYAAFRSGGATRDDIETLRAFIAAMK